jgi:succinoglycan biosynthesis protein ExoA
MTHATSLQWAIATARRSPLGHHPDSFIYSGQAQFSPASSVAVAYRKSVFDKVGYFDESFDACEDVEMNTRIDAAGLTCYFEPAIAVRYVPRNTLSGLAKQMNRYGRGRVRLWRKHRHTFSLKSFAPGLFVAGIYGLVSCYLLLFLVALCWELALDDTFSILPHTVILSILILTYILYVMVILAESVRLLFTQKRLDILLFLLLPHAFFWIHFGFGDGILWEFLFPKGSVKPESSAEKGERG